jgi:hypothetical protein
MNIFLDLRTKTDFPLSKSYLLKIFTKPIRQGIMEESVRQELMKSVDGGEGRSGVLTGISGASLASGLVGAHAGRALPKDHVLRHDTTRLRSPVHRARRDVDGAHGACGGAFGE